MAKTLVYQLYAPSWDNFQSLKEHLGRIKFLGADYVWLSGALKSLWYDHGYDVSNYKAIDPRLGSMADFDDFVSTAHDLGMGVLVDLVINHTSIYHDWFQDHPNYYCWSKKDRPGWKNLFDGGSAWKYDYMRDKYYCHLFHETQADLNWFPEEADGNINEDLVKEFRGIVEFWTKQHKVDGFRLDVPQSINKNLRRASLVFEDLLVGSKAVAVINAIFNKKNRPFLITELFDPTFGSITRYYTEEAKIDFAMNILIKESIREGHEEFRKALKKSSENSKVMLNIESHDSPRFNYGCWNSVWGIYQMFNANPQGICIYQGQELGLPNPTKECLPDHEMIRLDARTSMRHARGESLDDLRPTSRANARVPIPLGEYKRQEENEKSCLNLVQLAIINWRMHKRK